LEAFWLRRRVAIPSSLPSTVSVTEITRSLYYLVHVPAGKRSGRCFKARLIGFERWYSEKAQISFFHALAPSFFLTHLQKFEKYYETPVQQKKL
jgi:hypothetical protein